MPEQPGSYLMENLEEAVRLEVKTNPAEVRKQALWCGLKPGFHVLDAGCGPGKITSILYEMMRPGGKILGVDYSEARIRHATEHYGRDQDISFEVHDLRKPLKGVGPFDLIWVRFVLEYNRAESPRIVKNLTSLLKPDGHLCLLDLDHNSLSHYEMPGEMEAVLGRISARLEKDFNFDPYSGRKLYAYLYDLGYRDIQLDLLAHHLIYGKVKEEDMFNWIKKAEVITSKTRLFEDYPGGHKAFFIDFRRFFLDPRRFTYTPLILCKGMKPPNP
ncbi:MAG: class I SAM-dependent methyltransferase [Proteobacteria bacterium]|nr:class I SAM-dependent methyltransferase [Pseudomonadota bacterium]